MGNGPLFSYSILSFHLDPLFFLPCTFAPLRFFLLWSFLLGFFFFAAASGATTGAWNFWCIIGCLRCPYQDSVDLNPIP